MKQFTKYLKETTNEYRRGLITYEQFESKVVGYLQCMVDLGMLDKDRKPEELTIAIKGLFQ